jgi:hypothetical protein
MSASLLSFLSPSKIEEKLPEGVLPSSVSSGSVITFRSRSRYLPTSGTSYTAPTGSKIVQFRITGNDYLDMATAVLHFRLQINAPTTPKVLIQEGIYSIIQRCRAALNSVIVQDTDNAHVAANIKVLNTMPRQVYDSAVGQYMGLYKKSHDPDVCGAVFGATANQIAKQVSGYYNSSAATDTSNGCSFYVPLSLICSSIGGMSTFLPLRNVGNLELTFFLEDPSTCFFNPSGASMASASYTLNDVSIEVDTVQLAAPIVQLYDRLSADTSETGGIVIPVSTDVVQSINYSAGSAGQRSVSISRGTTALTQIAIAKRDQAEVGTPDDLALSSFQCFAQTRAQFRLGSRLYPTSASDSMARMFTETAHAYGNLNNLYAGGLVSRLEYETNDVDQGAFTYAYNFRRVLTEELGLDGENSIQSGSIVIYDFTDAPAASVVVLTALIESLRYIELKGSAVNVAGL